MLIPCCLRSIGNNRFDILTAASFFRTQLNVTLKHTLEKAVTTTNVQMNENSFVRMYIFIVFFFFTQKNRKNKGVSASGRVRSIQNRYLVPDYLRRLYRHGGKHSISKSARNSDEPGSFWFSRPGKILFSPWSFANVLEFFAISSSTRYRRTGFAASCAVATVPSSLLDRRVLFRRSP